ncbi:MAG: AAA family ATPase [Deltaproteobacteria bacterium]|nr:AAA family ATPase [Deltaproteobacteria bacterium]
MPKDKTLEPLPISQEVFQELIATGNVYVDKTGIIRRLLEDERKTIFISRPRRFGKTLLLSTVEAVLHGREDLFHGLEISFPDTSSDFPRKHFDWKRSHVIRLSLSDFVNSKIDFEESLMQNLRSVAHDLGVNIVSNISNFALTELIDTLYYSFADIQLRCSGNGVTILGQDAYADRQKVSVLIDESDFPLIAFYNEPLKFKSVQKTLSAFYNALKNLKQKGRLHLLLVTGITKFRDMFMDSGMNILEDLTFVPKFSNICGFTTDEIYLKFSNHLAHLIESQNPETGTDVYHSIEEIMSDIKEWYDGYSWDGKSVVHNPHSVLRFFSSFSFERYWYDTGAPGFLRLLELSDADYFKIYARNNFREEKIQYQDLSKLSPSAALLMTGYLSIKKTGFVKKHEQKQYFLTIPNKEVRISFSADHLIERPYPGATENDANEMIELYKKFSSAISTLDIDIASRTFSSMLSKYPYRRIETNERFFQNELARGLWFLDDVVRQEPSTGDGVPDFIVKLPEFVLVIEVKYNKTIDLIMELKSLSRQGRPDPYDPDIAPENQLDQTEKPSHSETSSVPDGVPGKPDITKWTKRSEAQLTRIQMLLERGINEAFTQIYIYKYARGDLGRTRKVYAIAVSVVDRTDVSIDCREVTYEDWRNDARPATPLPADDTGHC